MKNNKSNTIQLDSNTLYVQAVWKESESLIANLTIIDAKKNFRVAARCIFSKDEIETEFSKYDTGSVQDRIRFTDLVVSNRAAIVALLDKLLERIISKERRK